jgi:5'-3' exonuclease
MVRALIALLVGCDACPGGVSQKGPKVAFNLLKKHSNLSGEALHDKLAAEISSMKGAVVKDKAAVLCLAKSFLYETTNHVLCQSWCCSSALLLDLWLASRDRTQ